MPPANSSGSPTVDELKQLGNLTFGKGDYKAAIDYYTRALQREERRELYSNRSAANLKALRATEAVVDAEKTIVLDPHWFRGYQRLGAAFEQLKQLDKAKESYLLGIKECGTSEEINSLNNALHRVETLNSKSPSKTASTATSSKAPAVVSTSATPVSSTSSPMNTAPDIVLDAMDTVDDGEPIQQVSGSAFQRTLADAVAQMARVQDSLSQLTGSPMSGASSATQSSKKSTSRPKSRKSSLTASPMSSLTYDRTNSASASSNGLKAGLCMANWKTRITLPATSEVSDKPLTTLSYPLDEEAEVMIALKGNAELFLHQTDVLRTLPSVSRGMFCRGLLLDGPAASSHLQRNLVKLLAKDYAAAYVEVTKETVSAIAEDSGQSQTISQVVAGLFSAVHSADCPTVIHFNGKDVFENEKASDAAKGAAEGAEDEEAKVWKIVRDELTNDDSKLLMITTNNINLADSSGRKSKNTDDLTKDIFEPFAHVVVEIGPGSQVNAPLKEKHARRFTEIVESDPKLAALAESNDRQGFMQALMRHPDAKLVVRDMIRDAMKAHMAQESSALPLPLIESLKKNTRERGDPIIFEDDSEQDHSAAMNDILGEVNKLTSQNASSSPSSSSKESSPKGKAKAKKVEQWADFRTIVIRAPKEPSLFAMWQKMMRTDQEASMLSANKVVLRTALTKSNLRFSGFDAETQSVPSSTQLALPSSSSSSASLSATKEKDTRATLNKVLSERLLSSDECDSILAEAVRFRLAKRQAMKRDSDNKMLITDESLLYGLKTVCELAPKVSRKTFTDEEAEQLCENKYEETIFGSLIHPDAIGVCWSDVGGLEETKEKLKETTIYPMLYPELFQEGTAAHTAKGLLLFGPPGTGKTMLAKAIATETGASFLSIDSSTIGNKWYGESEKYAKAVFTLARKIAPCVIFIDEVDALLSSRDDTEKNTIASVKTTLMREWDGLGTTNDRVMVVGATNRPFVLDEAILRRMPRRILIDLPNEEERAEILRVTLEGNRVASSVDINALAKDLEQYSGSDIHELCREAAVRVSNEKAKELFAKNELSVSDGTKLREIDREDFDASKKRIRASVAKDSAVQARVKEWNEKYGESGTGTMDKPWGMYT